MQPEPRYKKGDKIGGRYLVHQALMGGMGEVYLCLDFEQDLPFALKSFQARYLTNPKLRQAFENEVATWVALEKHPNIVRCYHMERIDNQPFMILEWIASDESHGTDLRSWLARGPLDVRLALDFAIDICRGLIHAGQKQPGLVHRDLKPDNVLVAQGRLAKITDFGLAKVVRDSGLALPDQAKGSSARQHLSSMGGTPPYMAPEQWLGQELDCRTDIYALGCILFEMLTGRLPFIASTLDDCRTQHLGAEVPALSPTDSRAPWVNPLLAGCLAKAREQRFASPDALLDELSQICQRQFRQAPRVLPPGQDFTFVDYGNRGVTYAALGRHEEALADYAQALHISPSYSETYSNRALTYAALKRHEEALTDYAQALRISPNDAQVYCNRGATYDALRRYEEALADYAQAVRIDPNCAKAYSNSGLTYAELGRYEEALADYAQALHIDSNNANCYSNRGLTYAELERYEEALADYAQALRIDPFLARAYCNRGDTYRALGRHAEALVEYAQALCIDPNDEKPYNNRGLAFADLGRHEQALADYTQALRIDPSDAKAYYNRGLSFRALRRHEEALADYTQALRIDPKFEQAYNNRGNIYADVGRYEEALADYMQALRIDPDDAQAHRNVGSLLANRGALSEALPYFEKAAQLGHPTAAGYVAKIKASLGLGSTSEADPVQQVMAAFEQAQSREAMQQAVVQFPVLANPEFRAAIEQALVKQVPPYLQPAFEQRLAWLRQLASEE